MIGQALRKSLGVKMLSAFIGVIILVLSVFTVFAVLREEEKTKASLREQGKMLVELLSRSSMLGVFAENPKMLREATRDILSIHDVIAVSIYNNRFEQIHEERKGQAALDQWRIPEPEDGEEVRFPVVRETSETLDLITPVQLDSGGAPDESLYFGMGGKGSQRKVIGYARIVLSKERYHQEIVSVVKQNVLVTVIFIFLSSLLIYFAIRNVIAPLVNLTEKVKALGMGLPVEPVPVETGDEVGNLAASFNEMVRARSEAERSLRESEERYRRLVELSPDAIYVQHQGRIVFVNPSGVRLLGAGDPSQIMGKPAEDFIDESYRSTMEARLVQIEEGGFAIAPLQLRYRRLNSSPVEAEIAIALFPFQGSRAALVIARDQTERRGMEEKIRLYQKQLFSVASEMSSLESRVEERERHLIASDLHDYVGQNLAVMTFMVGRLQQTPPTPEAQRILGTIGETLEQTIQYTRSLTIELNPPILAELGFKPALDALVEAFEKMHGIRIKVEDDGRSKQVHGETRYLLFRCVRELLLNAVKHSRAMEVCISVSATGPLIRIAVEDNGIGFAAARNAGTDRGFGLYSVQERLKRLGGTCDIESASGRGTRVILTAPLQGKEIEGGHLGHTDTSRRRS
jgi:PAS domain S-box-containing protein